MEPAPTVGPEESEEKYDWGYPIHSDTESDDPDWGYPIEMFERDQLRTSSEELSEWLGSEVFD